MNIEKMNYRTLRELARIYRYSEKNHKPLLRLVDFIENHAERYPKGSVKRNDRGRVLIDLRAADDAYTYHDLIEQGMAPEYGFYEEVN